MKLHFSLKFLRALMTCPFGRPAFVAVALFAGPTVHCRLALLSQLGIRRKGLVQYQSNQQEKCIEGSHSALKT
jgi:hypothetical protein